jgi:hypothetical protein
MHAIWLAVSASALLVLGWWIHRQRQRRVQAMIRANLVVIARITHTLAESDRFSASSHAVIQYRYTVAGVTYDGRAPGRGRIDAELPVLVADGRPEVSMPVARLSAEGVPGLLSLLSIASLSLGLMLALFAVIWWLSPTAP